MGGASMGGMSSEIERRRERAQKQKILDRMAAEQQAAENNKEKEDFNASARTTAAEVSEAFTAPVAVNLTIKRPLLRKRS